MIHAIQTIAERRIREAIKEGRLTTSNWHGKPLPKEDQRFIPEELRMAYKILKNSGYLPSELETRKEIHQLEELLTQTEDEHTRVKQLKKLNVLLLKLDSMRGKATSLEDQEIYYRKITEKLTVHK